MRRRVGVLAVALLGSSSMTAGAFGDCEYSPTVLGTLPGGTFSQGLGVDASGQVAGTSDVGGVVQDAFFYDPTSGISSLGVLQGGSFSVGAGINDSGQVVGYGDTSSLNEHAFLSAANGEALTDLGTLFGGSYSNGNAVNNAGEVAGYGDTSTGATHAIFFSTAGSTVTATDLGTLARASNNTSYGYAINSLGQVAGVSDVDMTGTIQHAFLSGPGGGG